MKFQVSLLCCLILATVQCCWARATARQTVRPPLEPHRPQARCELVDVPMCAKIGWPQSTRMRDRATIELRQYDRLIRSCCSNAIVHFLCAHYTPFCHQGVTIPPCRQFCEYVRDGCQSVYQRGGMAWPEHMKCDKFPPYTGTTSNPNCIQPPHLDQLKIPHGYGCSATTNPPTTSTAQAAQAQAASNQPASTGTATNQPASTGTTTNQPASTATTANQPASTATTANQAPTTNTRPRAVN